MKLLSCDSFKQNPIIVGEEEELAWTASVCLGIFIYFLQIFVRVCWVFQKIQPILLHKWLKNTGRMWDKLNHGSRYSLYKIIPILVHHILINSHLIEISIVPAKNMVVLAGPNRRSILHDTVISFPAGKYGNAAQNGG